MDTHLRPVNDVLPASLPQAAPHRNRANLVAKRVSTLAGSIREDKYVKTEIEVIKVDKPISSTGAAPADATVNMNRKIRGKNFRASIKLNLDRETNSFVRSGSLSSSTVDTVERKKGKEDAAALGRVVYLEEMAKHLTPIFNKNTADAKNLSPEQLKVVCQRLYDYALECDIPVPEMLKNIQHGKVVAEEILNAKGDKEYAPRDLVAFDWFIRAQQAKSGDLYLKGTFKCPDPDNKILAFMLNVKGSFHGQEVSPYERPSSHWPEKQAEITSQAARRLPNDDVICFNAKSEKGALAKAAKAKGKKVHVYTRAAIGIDTTQEKGLRAAGGGSNTFMVMPMIEDVDGQKVPVLGVKTEGNSAVSLVNVGYGKMSDRAIDLAKHGMAFMRKKGPEVFRENSVEPLVFKDRKEDKLHPLILAGLNSLDLNVDEPRCKVSYAALGKTTGGGSDYALPELKAHLENMKNAPGLDATERQKITSLIEVIEKHAASRQDNGSKYKLSVRSNEVLMPSLEEMLAGHVPYRL